MGSNFFGEIPGDINKVYSVHVIDMYPRLQQYPDYQIKRRRKNPDSNTERTRSMKTPAMGETCLATITLEVGSRGVGLWSIDNNIYNSVTHANLKFINLASTIS